MFLFSYKQRIMISNKIFFKSLSRLKSNVSSSNSSVFVIHILPAAQTFLADLNMALQGKQPSFADSSIDQRIHRKADPINPAGLPGVFSGLSIY